MGSLIILIISVLVAAMFLSFGVFLGINAFKRRDESLYTLYFLCGIFLLVGTAGIIVVAFEIAKMIR